VTVTIRPATPADTAAMQAIERLAGQRFREVGLPGVADDEPASAEELAAYVNAGRAWVADDDGQVYGYLLVDDVDGAAHIEQVTVLPDRQGQGIGRALIDRAELWARASGRPALTLTTFRDVPWNRPLYEHLGFRVLAEGELSPGLVALRAHEAAHGLDPALRVVMRRDVRPEINDPTSA
jgi:GNAT superfamily N-acetyltransferase